MADGDLHYYAVLTEYDGQAFSGWQRQANAPSVQACLEDAWHKLTGERIRLTGGSRTDAGVSARGHVSAFKTSTSIPRERLALAWNTALPPQAAIRDVRPVASAFNPRYDALGKTYLYTIRTGPTRPVLDRGREAHVPGFLDREAMRQAARGLLGTHDFTAFMDQGSSTRRPRRTLHEISLTQEADSLHIKITGDGFLYHMVRILAGTLVAAGQGKIPPDTIEGIIRSGDRTLAGPTMPSQGLVLERIYFADHLFGQDSWPYDDSRRAAKLAHLDPKE